MYKVVGADKKEYGPAGPEQIQQWIREHRLNGQSLARAEDSEAWRPLSEFPEFQSLLAELAPRTLAAGVSPALAGPVQFPDSPRANILAVLSLVMGLLAVSLGCCCYGLPFNILGLVFSVIALSQISQNPERERGKGLAVAGLILCLLSFFLAALGWYFSTPTFRQNLL